MRVFLPFALLAVSMSASAQPRGAAVSALSLGFGVAARTGSGSSAALVSPAIDYMRSIGPGVLIAQVGASGSVEVLGPHRLPEAHLAIGAASAAGPAQFSLVAGPFIGSASGSAADDPVFADGERVTVVGAYVSARAAVAIVGPVGIGAEGFALINGPQPLAGGRVSLVLRPRVRR